MDNNTLMTLHLQNESWMFIFLQSRNIPADVYGQVFILKESIENGK